MSYSLYFQLKPAILHEDMFYYFVGRAHYAANGGAFVYENPDTETFFSGRVPLRTKLSPQKDSGHSRIRDQLFSAELFRD